MFRRLLRLAWRGNAAAAAVVVVLVGVAVAVDRALATRDYADRRYGWTVDVPRGLEVRPFVRHHRVIAVGALFATVPVQPSAWPSLRDMPSDATAFLLYRFHGPVSSPGSGPETSFPFSLAALDPVPYARPKHRGRWLRGSLEANGWYFIAEAWIGNEASDADTLALERLVGSLCFEPLREGTITGDGFYVLGRTDAYPVGSVTRSPARKLPITHEFVRLRDFFLVRAPRRFYSVAGMCDRTYGYAGCSWCDVRYDPEAQSSSAASARVGTASGACS
jgi:hypothetical protein